jgi:hypothetical protein
MTLASCSWSPQWSRLSCGTSSRQGICPDWSLGSFIRPRWIRDQSSAAGNCHCGIRSISAGPRISSSRIALTARWSVTVDAPVAGEVYLNEPHFSERRAYVDGEPVDARQTNIAFTAVPVQAGRHRVELRFVPTSFYAGGAMSGLTLVVSLVTGWRVSRTIDARASS